MFDLARSLRCTPGPRRQTAAWYRTGWLLFGCSCLLAAGCKPREEIRRYQVPKVVKQAAASVAKEAPKAGPGQMLAAVALHGDQGWFFKVVGSPAAVSPHAEDFRALLRSLEFVEGKPRWKAPESWRQQPGAGMRFATLELGASGESLPLTVISLPKLGEDSAYVLSNVNRWREQLGLPEIAAGQLSQESEQVPYTGGVATLVNLLGRLPASGTGGMGGMGGM